MTKWEYTILVTPNDLKDELNNLGQESWEVFRIDERDATGALELGFIRIYAKRPIE